MGKSVKLKITEDILLYFYKAFSETFGQSYQKVKQKHPTLSKEYFKTAINRLANSGYLKLVRQNGVLFLEITKQGEIKTLMHQAVLQRPKNWDGKWRVIIFDIPENSRNTRAQLRYLLKRNDFYKLQASVFISPYSLNRQAIDYLKETGLIKFIRILRVDEVDDDSDLKKRFNLK